MKWISLLSAFVVALGMNAVAQADLFDLSLNRGAAKSCECASTCQPECCRPTITKPCEPNVYTYQRQCSSIKPPCCGDCAPACCKPLRRLRRWMKRSCCSTNSDCCTNNNNCAPKNNCCTPAPKNNCCPAPKACCAPAPKACTPAPKACCAPAPKACTPAPKACCVPAPAPKACCTPAPKACTPAPKACCAPAPKNCCPAPKNCAAPAAESCCNEPTCCPADPCLVAELIYRSQTACYAKQRRRAIRKLGKLNCECNPEIMCAFIYALNDADERVRREAADKIGDQLRKNNCCCSPQLTAALTCALGDCDKKVVREATQALRLCGYDVVEGDCGQACCDTSGCAPNGCAPKAPAPSSDPKAYFPSRLKDQKQSRRSLTGNSLSNLFGLID